MESEVNSILVAAHELKAPLALLRQLAFSFDLAKDDSARQKIKHQMISTSDRALKQINDLTKVARLEDDFFEVEPVAIRGVCKEVTSDLEQLFRLNHRKLKISYTNRSRLVVANRELLSSIIYNFCLNAIHYSDEQTFSEMHLKDHRNFVRLSVRDYGPALPPDIAYSLKNGWLEKPTSIAMRPGSSGLGLYIASCFSRYMNAPLGAIRHRDGTSFFVDLPISKQASFFA